MPAFGKIKKVGTPTWVKKSFKTGAFENIIPHFVSAGSLFPGQRQQGKKREPGTINKPAKVFKSNPNSGNQGNFSPNQGQGIF